MNCDHRLRMQGDISTWSSNPILTWCERCGSIKSSVSDEWNEPRSMLALRLLLAAMPETVEPKLGDAIRAAHIVVEGGELP